MFEVDVKNVMEKGRRGGAGGDQLGFGVLILPRTVHKLCHISREGVGHFKRLFWMIRRGGGYLQKRVKIS